MKTRRHHNNSGLRQIKRGKTTEQVRRIAKKLRLPFASHERRARMALELSRRFELDVKHVNFTLFTCMRKSLHELPSPH